jgi:4-amino-4-deoxychorismate lyase
VPNLSKQFLINGTFQKISPFDRAFQYGDGIFRTFVVENKKALHWKYHYKKIVEDCLAMKITPPKEKDLLEDIHSLFKSNKKSVGKFIISRGISERGYKFNEDITHNRFLIKTKMPIYPKEYFKNGINLYVCKQKLNPSILSGVKHLNRLENIMARQEWKSDHYADGILLDQKGNVIECISSNIFMRIGKTIYTPKINQVGVKGVTRELILKISAELGFKIKEAIFDLNKLLSSDEVFITNSLFGVLQVKKIKNKSWHHQTLASLFNHSLEHLNT